MLVVLASRTDTAAQALCARAPAGNAHVLTWRDLSTPGWRYYGDPDDRRGAAVIGGRPTADKEISAVVTRCPSVPPHELGHIVPGDRAYVAAEMTALLLAWLTRLPCPVINRPHGGCLCGPRWAPERWTVLATSLGLRALPVARRAMPGLAPSRPRPAAPPGADTRSVTIVGSRAMTPSNGNTDVPEELADDALRLARRAGLSLVRVEFAIRGSEHWFLGADLNVDLADASVADALLEHAGVASRRLSTTAS